MDCCFLPLYLKTTNNTILLSVDIFNRIYFNIFSKKLLYKKKKSLNKYLFGFSFKIIKTLGGNNTLILLSMWRNLLNILSIKISKYNYLYIIVEG